MKAFANLFSQKKNKLIFYTTCGPATTFDPKITGVDGVWYFDDGTTLAAASGAEISKTFATDGLHRAVYRPASGGLAAITHIVASTDLITRIDGLSRLRNLQLLDLNFNASLAGVFPVLPNLVNFYCNGCIGLVGQVAALPAKLTGTLNVSGSGIAGQLSDLPNIIALYCFGANSPLEGGLDDLPASIQTAWLYGNTRISAGSIAQLVAVRDLRIYNIGFSADDMGIVIDSIFQNRGDFTYASPSLVCLTGNATPDGNYAAPPVDESENTDWEWDAGLGHHWPVSDNAKRYYLGNGPDRGTADTFNRWAIT